MLSSWSFTHWPTCHITRDKIFGRNNKAMHKAGNWPFAAGAAVKIGQKWPQPYPSVI